MNYTSITAQPEYDIAFWDSMRTKPVESGILAKASETSTGTYAMPDSSANKFMKALIKESVFRNMATVLKAYKTGYRLYTKDCKDKAQFVKEGGQIPIYDGMEDFNTNSIGSYKLASIVKLDEEFVNDAGFDIEKHLTERFGKTFARAEDDAFINGSGADEPTGILATEGGAETGITAIDLTYDDMISLYFSVDKEYRRNGMWLMNDRTALALRKLKDNDGNYLWNNADNTILGKPVVISEYMPDADSGNKPVAFGDFSYYWIIGRKPVSVRSLTEKFSIYDQVGYLGVEYLDGKLVRNEAIKVIQITDKE